MSTLTIFFNSDGDISEQGEATVCGLDNIATGPRPHLMTALSNKAAHFTNRYFRKLFKNGINEVDTTLQIIDKKGNFIVNGPGSGYYLNDAKFSNSPSFAEGAGIPFIDLWNDDIYKISQIVSENRSAFNDRRHNLSKLDQLIKELPRDWIARQFQLKPGVFFESDSVQCTKINLVGWGRGGVSCHMLANRMKNDSNLSNVTVNILAIDPVTGNDFAPDQITLGSNVKEYVGLYARDERSASLPCIVPDTDPNTRVHIYPIAGRHTTLIGNQAVDGDKSPGTFSEPSDLVFYLAMKCLNRWDPSLSINAADSGGYPDLSISGNDVLAKIKSEYDNYLNMRSTTYANQRQELINEREILLNGQLTNFKSAQGPRFTPNQGLAKGHIEDMSYFQDST